MIRLTVNVGNGYDIIAGCGATDKLSGYIPKNMDKAMIITDSNVGKLYADKVFKIVECGARKIFKYEIAAGEESKSLENYSAIMSALAKNAFSREDIIIALGGGVVGDLAGFAAATYLRGIKYIQMPTTLLSVVDSSVGGKTAVNLQEGKNLVGAFYQPHAVIADLDFLKTLPDAELKNGKGEILKYGILLGGRLFADLEKGDFTSESVLADCIDYKRAIVEEDERDENGRRALLNLGHTLGHAVEKLSGYSVPHGEAVCMGIMKIAKAENRRGALSDADCNKIMNIIEKEKLCREYPYGDAELIEAAGNDKKSAGGYMTLIAIERIGKCVTKKIPLGSLPEYLG